MELRVLYEKYFLDLIPLQPEKQHKAVKDMIRNMQKMPFHNAQTKFRLRHVVNRYQTYDTYWARVLREREEGKYSKDVFRADLREKIAKEERDKFSRQQVAEKGMQQLYNSYEQAMKKCGASGDNINFDAFKKSLQKKAKALKAKNGAKKVQYKIVIKNGKPVVKASTKG